MPEDCHIWAFIIVKLHLQAFPQDLENGKMQKIWFLFEKPLRISETTQHNSQILHKNSPWVYVNKVCSNSFATYIISEIIVKVSLNIANVKNLR